MKSFIRILAVLVFVLTILLSALLLYFRQTEPVFQNGSVLILTPDKDPSLWESWMKAYESKQSEKEDFPVIESANSQLVVLSIDLRNPGPVPVEWIGITPEVRPSETLITADNGPLLLAANSEGTLKAAILTSKMDNRESREMTVIGYRLGKKVTIRLVADENEIHTKGEK